MMSSACIQSNGDGESQIVQQMSASPGEAAASTEDVPKTPPIARKNMSTPEKEKDSPIQSPGSPIGDDACPICLGEISDRCVADSCFHGFCLICLKEWSKQKAVCPLCKQKFTKIMYDIKSETDYKEWKVPVPDPQQHHNVTLNLENFREFLNVENRRFFGYHTTNFPGALALHRHFPRRGQNLNTIPDAIPSGPRERRPSRFNLRGSSMFRLSVYLNNVWVQPLADITGRYRQTGPELYREQPALTHRLAPWVNRELQALLPEPRIGTVLREMMQLIEEYPINSREFRRTMLPHLGSRTNHFVHEFYNFARSPYDMVGHDNAAQYIPRYGNVNDTDSSSSSDDSDAIVEVDSRGNPLSISDANLPPATAATVVPVVRQETLTQEGSVVISSGSSSSSDSSSEDESARLRNDGLSAETHNPEPPARFMKRLIKRARTFLNTTVNSGASTSSVQVGSGSGASSSGSSSRTGVHIDCLLTQANGRPEQAYNSDDSTGCMIIQEVNRIGLTPELINLSSDGNGDQDDEAISKRLLRRGKTKPSLRRNNFANRKPQHQGPDHTYCTAESSTAGGNTSNTSNKRNVQSKNRRCGRISEEKKRSSVNDSDYVPGDSEDESLSLSSSDTASSSHSEWGPSSEKNYKKRSQRKQKNRNGIANNLLNKKRADLESQSESGCNSDSDSNWGSVSDKVSYYRYLQRLNKNRKEKVQNKEENNTSCTKKLSSNLVLEELRVPPIPSSSHGIDSDSEVVNSSSEGENSSRNMTSIKTHKHSIKNKTDNPSKVKKSFSIQFNTSLNVKQETGVLFGIDKEQILRRRILARQNLLKASLGDVLSDKSTDSMEQRVSLPGSSSEKSQKAQSPSESTQNSLCSRKKDHSSKIKKSANKVETEYEKPFESHRQDTLLSSQASENDHRSSVESQTNRKRNRKSSKEKKKKKRKKDEKEKYKEREKSKKEEKEKYKEREKSKRKEKKKKRAKSKKIRRIESSSEENNSVSE